MSASSSSRRFNTPSDLFSSSVGPSPKDVRGRQSPIQGTIAMANMKAVFRNLSNRKSRTSGIIHEKPSPLSLSLLQAVLFRLSTVKGTRIKTLPVYVCSSESLASNQNARVKSWFSNPVSREFDQLKGPVSSIAFDVKIDGVVPFEKEFRDRSKRKLRDRNKPQDAICLTGEFFLMRKCVNLISTHL